jgi:creatinine amidohydrolase
MLLKLCTWQEVETYLGGANGILVPIGSTEQHGPNGLIGTDFITAEAIAQKAGEISGALVAPTFTVGSAQHHLGFPGTISLRPSVLIEATVDWITSLARHGFTRIYFVNGHGGNIAPVQTAFAEYYARYSIAAPSGAAPALCRLVSWWTLPNTARLIDELYGEDEGLHATMSEVSMTQYLYPDARKHVPPFLPVPKGSHHDIHDSADYRRRFRDGRIGSDPARSNPDDGKRLFDCVSAEVAVHFQAFAEE